MPDQSSLYSGAAQSGAGLLSGLTGIMQIAQGGKKLKKLGAMPIETLPDEFQQNQNMAQTMAATGMPSEQYNLAMKNIQRQQLMALRAANDRRGGLNVLPQILQGGNDATLKLDANNAAMRTANQRNLMSVNSQVGGIKRDLFDRNIRQKYQRDYDYAMGLIGQGNKNALGGLDKMLGGGGSMAANAGGDFGGSSRRNQYNPSYSEFLGGD